MTIDEIRAQIEQRLAEAREEADRLQAALDALSSGDTGIPPVDAAKARRQPRAAPARQSAPRGGTRPAVLEALASGDAMTAGQLATLTGLPRERIAPELSNLVKAGALVKADRGYQTPPAEASTPTSSPAPTPNGKPPEILALGRELDAGLRTRP